MSRSCSHRQRSTSGSLLGALVLTMMALSAAAQPNRTAAPVDIDALNESIRRCRMGDLIVLTPPGADVKVTQVRHAFRFGTAIAWPAFFDNSKMAAADRDRYKQVVRDNFNCAVHENELKWYHTEPKAGSVSYEHADRMLRWCEENGISMRGHCVFWEMDQYVQTWVKQLPDDALRQRLEDRAQSVMARYRGRIGEYDVNNEMVHGHYYASRLGDDIHVEMFKWCHEADPQARLYVNDYNIFYNHSLEAYERQIQGLLDRKVPVGGIGIQAHFGRAIDYRQMRTALDRLAAFKVPICITELDMDTPVETAKAEGLENAYRIAFAHPAVDGILLWGFWEGAHWKPRAALWKKDWTPTPAAEMYRRLVFQDWWTRFDGTSDAAGRSALRAFYGRHRVQVGGREKDVDVVPGAPTVVNLR